METIATLDISETQRLAVYPDYGTYSYDELTGEGLGVYTLDIVRGYSDIKGGPCTDDLDRLTRHLDRDLHERAIGLYLYLNNRTYKRLSLRGYSQGEWAEVIVYADAGDDGKWLESPNATSELEAWFRGDVYTVAHESLEVYTNLKNGDLIERWESSDAVGMVTLSNDYTLADAGRDLFGLETSEVAHV